jgi:hypothetical protein
MGVGAQSPARAAKTSALSCAGYMAGDGWHDVLVGRDETGRWSVLDAGGARLVLVETLTGHDDRLGQARALARDYAAQQAAYRDGRRDTDPLPRPQIITRD